MSEFWEDVARKSKQSDTKPMNWSRHFSPKSGTILELGAHKGANLLQWAIQGFACHGNDISQTCKDIFEENKRKLKLENCNFSVEPAEEFECDTQFDYVVLSSMLESVESPLRVLQAAAKALKPNGEIYIACLQKWWVPPIRTQKRIVDVKTLELCCKEAKLRLGKHFTAGKQGQFLIAWAYHE